MTTIWGQLQERARRTPGTPLVTYVDGARAERTELSAASLENAAAKIANALRDEYELEPGTLVSLRLPLHWQRSAWCAGVWTARCIVSLDDPGPADLVVTDLPGAGSAVAASHAPIAVVSMHPLGLPPTEPVPEPAHDATIVVRRQPDGVLFEPPLASDPALRLPGGIVLSQSEVAERAGVIADQWGLGAGGRLLVTEPMPDVEGLLACIAVPMAVGASVVLGRDILDVDGLRRTEKVTATASR